MTVTAVTLRATFTEWTLLKFGRREKKTEEKERERERWETRGSKREDKRNEARRENGEDERRGGDTER